MIIGAMLARNEAAPDRYLRRALCNAAQFCDRIIVVDDGSTDDTAQICAQVPSCRVITRPGEGWWGQDETSARAALWEAAAQEAGPDGWIYHFDADHELLGISPEDFRMLTAATIVNAWCFVLYDCWDSEDLHRVDGYWIAWKNPRPWLVRAMPFPNWEPQWRQRGIHAGHHPGNYPYVTGIAFGGIRHLGYVKKEHRLRKSSKYLSLGVDNA